MSYMIVVFDVGRHLSMYEMATLFRALTRSALAITTADPSEAMCAVDPRRQRESPTEVSFGVPMSESGNVNVIGALVMAVIASQYRITRVFRRDV